MGLAHPFNELLRAAFEASEAADGFDVDSSDPASVAEWDRLLGEADRAELALITHILTLFRRPGAEL